MLRARNEGIPALLELARRIMPPVTHNLVDQIVRVQPMPAPPVRMFYPDIGIEPPVAPAYIRRKPLLVFPVNNGVVQSPLRLVTA